MKPRRARKVSPEELARRKRIGANMKRAREKAGLTQREVAIALDVDPTTPHRWERRGVVPRAKWADIERLYGTTQGAIERGEVAGTNGAAHDPPFQAWREFTEWLETSKVRAEVKPWMLESLRSVKFDPGKPPKANTYKQILYAYLDMDEDAAR